MVGGHSGGAQSDNAPANHDSSDPDRRSEVLEQDIARKLKVDRLAPIFGGKPPFVPKGILRTQLQEKYLHDYMRNEKNGYGNVVLYACKPKLRHHVVLRDVVIERSSVSQVCAIQIIDQVREAYPG